jgi:2-polyprenyl-6-methoxyphenol hydroxylase-like FAD-dependent oxidoreductase
MQKAMKNIAIVGAGLGGLTAALALMQRGFDVTVYEQAAVASEIGAGIQISANVTRVLFELGLEEQLRSVAAAPGGKEIRLWNTGQCWKLFDLGQESVERFGFPYFTLHRADFHSVLLDAVLARNPGAVKLDHRLTSFDQDGSGVTLNFANGETERADVLIGADGVHSAVRQGLFGEGDDPLFTGCMVWRGVAPAKNVPDLFRRHVGVNWVGPGGHIVHYPMRRGELVNFVGAIERDDWLEESWQESGSVEECLGDYQGWNDDIRSFIANINTTMKWALFIRKTLPKWHIGRVVLMGDACHATLPFLAQGAGMAIEDGLVLARALEVYDQTERAFDRYDAARIARCTAIVEGSNENAGRFHNSILATDEAADFVSREWASGQVSDRYDWIFTYDATAVEI